MIEPKIINRGRGPEIEGTRITVYDVLEYYDEDYLIRIDEVRGTGRIYAP